MQHRAEECDEQRHEEWDVLVVHEEEKAKGDLASMLGDSQRIRRLLGGAWGGRWPAASGEVACSDRATTASPRVYT
jgi:hypothetical protein